MPNRNGNNDKKGNNGSGKDKSGSKKSSPKIGQKPRGNASTKIAKTAEKHFAFERDDSPRLNSPRREKQAQPLNDMRLGELTIDRMSHDGRGISTWNGKTLFVDGALTGEKIHARLVQDHSRFAEARMDKLLEASPLRVEPVCQHYAECGGCQLQHLRAENQIALKQEAVLAQLESWGGVKPKHLLPAITAQDQGYRRAARLGVVYRKELENLKPTTHEAASVTLGFRKQNSKQLVQITHCSVLAEPLNKLLAPLQDWLENLQAECAVTHIELVASDAENAIIIRHTSALAAGDLAALNTLSQTHKCMIYLQGNETHQLQDVAGNPVDPRLHYSLPGTLATPDSSNANTALSLAFHPLDFIQINPNINAQMVAQALQLLALKGNERVLDLFCGIGNFTLALAQHCAEVIGIEAVESMVMRGRENAAKLGMQNAQFMAANLLTMTEHRLQQTCGKIDAILLDPPRDGAKEIIGKLPQLSPKRIVYVSCNPATLARDAKVLAAAGYQLHSVGILDMFPHTAHVESMALFVRH